VRVGRSGKGSVRRWCGFNASILDLRGEAMGQSEMKRRHRAHLDSMGRKRDDVGQRRGGIGEGKETIDSAGINER
jgi:hypothetical protein